jgi:hypothetical protein
MNIRRSAFLAALIAATVVAVGCSNNGVNPKAQSSTDQGAISATLATEPDFLDDGFFDATATTNLAPSLRGVSPAPGATFSAIDPFFFWRSITHRTTGIEFAFADTDSTGLPRTADVTVRHTFTGTFNIVPRDPSNPDLPDTHHVVQKPLIDHWVRHFLVKRIDLAGISRPVWKIAAATAIQVTSENATSAITSVHVQSTTVDTTLTDPTVFIPFRRVLRFAAEDTVTVTVTTPRTDDVVLLYNRDRRMRLTNNGDGTYTGKFKAGLFTAWRHFAVNALSHGTLFDDTAPYDSKAWVYPYVVVGGPSVDYLP